MTISYNEQRKKKIREKALKRRRKRIITIAIIAAVVIAVVAVGSYLLITYRTYSGYSVKTEIAISGSDDNLSYHEFGNYYLQCSDAGVICFDKNDILWTQNMDMSSPIIDICGDYAAVADMKQTDVYILDKNGLVGCISASHSILDVEIASNGVVALATNDSQTNYIELKDINGNELINVKSIFSSSGYLDDITLSEDGTRLAASFIYTSQGTVESKVLFYDFSGDNTDDMLVGGFNQYSGTVLTDVAYMENDIVCAIGDNAFTFYKFNSTPTIISESLELDWEIQSLTYNDKYVLFIVKDASGENNYRAKVYNTSGNSVADFGFDFAYSKAVLAGNNILLYSSTDCCIYSFAGYKRFAGAFDNKISYILPLNSASSLLFSTVGSVQFINMK